MRLPKVSIITITYNSESHLEETIRSVEAQDYRNIEYIIVDGGSTDRTMQIAQEHSGSIATIISEPDDGISDAMNKGIKAATGEIIGMIHSDDYYANGSVISTVAAEFMKSENTKITYGIQDFVDPKTGEVLLSWGREAEPDEIKKRMYMPHPTVFCRRELYEKAGVFRLDYKYAMDYEWAIRAVTASRPVFINKKIAVMRAMGQSGKNFRLSLKETERAIWEHGFITDYLLTRCRNIIKGILLGLGLKSLIYKLWARNVSPRD